MSRIGDLETSIVNRLAAATISGATVFNVVRGATGGYRPFLRDALARERTPVAYVAFIEDPLAPEHRFEVQGAHFSVLVAARTLRQGKNPRVGDTGNLGALALIDAVQNQLDNWSPSSGIQMINLRVRFIDGDDRTAVYEILYRAWPSGFEKTTPSAPEDLHFALIGSSTALEWVAPSAWVGAQEPDYFKIYRRGTGDAGYSLFDTATKASLAKILASLDTSTTLYYVTAVNTAGESSPSNVLADVPIDGGEGE